MTGNGQTRIVVRHVSGSKVNQVEQIALNGLREITIGRDPGCNIAYDQKRDDVVSRRHAAIRIGDGDKPSSSWSISTAATAPCSTASASTARWSWCPTM